MTTDNNNELEDLFEDEDEEDEEEEEEEEYEDEDEETEEEDEVVEIEKMFLVKNLSKYSNKLFGVDTYLYDVVMQVNDYTGDMEVTKTQVEEMIDHFNNTEVMRGN